MDPLSDVLSILKPRPYAAAGFDAAGAWSIQFPRNEGIKCYAVASGQCWLSVDGVPDPMRLSAGDCFLLPNGRPFRLASDLAVPPLEGVAVLSGARKGGVAIHNGGGEFFLAGASFVLDGNDAGILLGMLPPVVHLRKEPDQAALRWSMERMMEELRERQPGGFLVVQHLAHMMLVQALRVYLADGLSGGIGWLFALADKQMGSAISAMHGNPAHRWTLQELADRVYMSRSSFALKFKKTVGTSPMDYLTRWRMLLAGDRLTNSGDPVSAVALSLGYESESSFSTAFKRVMGCSPRQYSRDRIPASPSR
jgi:AraC-like DNA-binding protein